MPRSRIRKTAFQVSVSLNAECQRAADCPHRHLPDLARGVKKRYHFGKLSDRELVDEYVAEVLPLFERARSPVFVSEGVCYGPDQVGFIDSLDPTPEERAALERVLPEVQGLFEVEDATASRALEKLWPDHAETIVQAIVPDPDRASRLVREARSSPGRVERAPPPSRSSHPRARGARGAAAVRRPRARSGVSRCDRTSLPVPGARAAEKLLVERLPREGKQRGLAFGVSSSSAGNRPIFGSSRTRSRTLDGASSRRSNRS